ncbi:MAG: urease accessory protein UreD [Rhodospirillaceae bacterium]
MLDGTSRSEPPVSGSDAISLQRARGLARLHAKVSGGRTRIADLYQDGCAKVRLPRMHGGPSLEAVLLNTAGGLTGGDVFETDITADADTAVTVTTQACERVYRAADGAARVHNRLSVGSGARVHWLPQETILFDGGRIGRHLDIDMAADAVVLAVEPLVLGRVSSGEELGAGLFTDCWRIRRAGRLVFADDTRLYGDIAGIAARPGALSGARAAAMVVMAAPDAEDRLPDARAILDRPGAGASAFDGILVCRLIAADSYELRRTLAPLLTLLAGGPLPKVWLL